MSRRTTLLPIAVASLLLWGCGGQPSDSASKDSPKAATTEEPAGTPEPETSAISPDDVAAKNAEALTGFEAIINKLTASQAAGQPYPLGSIFLESDVMEGKMPENPFMGRAMRADHSFLGLEAAGDYAYTQISMPDGTQAGYVMLGYGDTGADGPSEAVTDTFFEARNWVGFNQASTDPRLPNDVPAAAIFAKFVLKDGVGQTPPSDFEEPPQESLVGE